MIVFRQAARTFTNPSASSIELLIGLYAGYVYVQPVVVHFVVHRLYLLVNKLTYILVSLLTAFKNKKQRIKH